MGAFQNRREPEGNIGRGGGHSVGLLDSGPIPVVAIAIAGKNLSGEIAVSHLVQTNRGAGHRVPLVSGATPGATTWVVGRASTARPLFKVTVHPVMSPVSKPWFTQARAGAQTRTSDKASHPESRDNRLTRNVIV
jgi:hypothetical protein